MPVQSNPDLELTFKASGAVTKRRAITYAGAQVATQGAKVFGVSQYDVADTAIGTATVSGTAVIETGGAFAIGASLIADASGRAIASTGALALKTGATAVTSTAANGSGVLSGGDMPEYVFADALVAATAVGQLVEVLLRR